MNLAVVYIAVFLTLSVAWLSHVVVSIQTQSWILLIIGIVVPPIGWVHGVMTWFGAGW